MSALLELPMNRCAMIVLWVAGLVPPSLNQYAKWHFGSKMRCRDAWRQALALQLDARRDAERQILLAWSEERVPITLEVTVYRRKLLDEDNLRGGLKPMIDALRRYDEKRKGRALQNFQGLGWIAGDEARLCKQIVTQIQVKNKQQVGTEIVIRPREDGSA